MSKRRVPALPGSGPGDSLTIQSLGRRPGLGGRSTARLELPGPRHDTGARRTEVLVKVSGGGRDRKGVRRSLAYIDRHGALTLETDTGERLQGPASAVDLARRWNLDALPTARGTRDGRRRSTPKAAHNIVLSMPGSVPPDKVLAAARTFARENFALAHRYAMVLHTDTAHPHVHLVVKAEREDATGRLNIYKATLQRWRTQFALALREQGVEATATRPSRAAGRARTAEHADREGHAAGGRTAERAPDLGMPPGLAPAGPSGAKSIRPAR